MKVFTFETLGLVVADYNPVTDTLQFPEELVNTFDYESTDSISHIFREFLTIAEDITANKPVDLEYNKLNEAMGQIGLGQEVIALKQQIEGI